MKNYTIIFSWPPNNWMSICPKCLKKKGRAGIVEIRPSPCKCDYCGAPGERRTK